MVAMRGIKSMILMKHKKMTMEQAMRVVEFEFETSEDGKTIEGLDYWLGNGRRKTNYRRIDMSGDAEFDETFYEHVYRFFHTPPPQSNAPSTD